VPFSFERCLQQYKDAQKQKKKREKRGANVASYNQMTPEEMSERRKRQAQAQVIDGDNEAGERQ